MLIDVSYFTAGPRQILNATLGKGTTKENAVIEQYIAESQWEFLRGAVGEEAAAELLTHLEGRPADSGATDGAAIEAVCARLREPFADFVFFRVLRDSGQTATITGLVRLKGANQYVEPVVRQVTAWNRMAEGMSRFVAWARSGRCPIANTQTDPYLLEHINRFNL